MCKILASKICLILVLACFFQVGKAQFASSTDVNLTENAIFFIPAIAGSKKYKEIKFSNTIQWAGQVVPINSYQVVLDGGILADNIKRKKLTSYSLSSKYEQIGYMSNFNFSGNYTYQIFLKENRRNGMYFLRFSLGGRFNLLSFNFDKLRPKDLDDPIILEFENYVPTFDVTASVFFHHKHLFWGLGLDNLLYDNARAYFYGGKVLYNGLKSDIVPSVFLRFNKLTGKTDFEARIKFIRLRKYWGSFGFRNNSVVSGGGLVLGKMTLAYTFDLNLRSISPNYRYNFSHNLYFSYAFLGPIQRVECPIW